MVTIDTIEKAKSMAVDTGKAVVVFQSGWVNALIAFVRWWRQRRTRLHLSQLTADQLRDIGITKAEALREVGRSRFLPIERPIQPPL